MIYNKLPFVSVLTYAVWFKIVAKRDSSNHKIVTRSSLYKLESC